MATRLLVCGSRDWDDARAIEIVLRGVASTESTELIHGGARGADALADGLGRRLLGEPCVEVFPADWRGHGRGAGPIRNRLMLEQNPSAVFAFKDEFDWSFQRGGTENMVQIARAAGVPTYVISHG